MKPETLLWLTHKVQAVANDEFQQRSFGMGNTAFSQQDLIKVESAPSIKEPLQLLHRRNVGGLDVIFEPFNLFL